MGGLIYVDPAPLVHHERPHAENDTLEVACLVVVAEDFSPCGFAELVLDADIVEDLVELALDLCVFVTLVKEASDDMTSFVITAVFGEPAGRFAEEGGAAEGCPA